jgi:hypothetical protein
LIFTAACRTLSVADFVLAGAFLAGLGLAFLAAQFWGAAPVSLQEFDAYLRSRMAHPDIKLTSYMYYRTLAEEIADTWIVMPANALRFPIYAALIALHLPLISYFNRTIRGLREPVHQQLVYTAIVLVSLGYVIMLGVVFDYARFISDWATCMILILFAVKALPAREVPAFAGDDQTAQWLGWIVSIIPRVGTTKPF